MNQAILFPDREQWHEARQMVIFPVQVNGALFECHLSAAWLNQQSGQSIDEGNAITIFQQHRFSAEELAEEAIEDDAIDDDGIIYLG
ncbi:hypothetical protein VST7929_00096 [Vibrio stylophorae]|uniref:DUF1488 domain-containing protein n=1 Tax=Vibrio stylophorae TaxID=659351 RepID=A0ABM8ZPP6_9VIBR|nr:DUF1488 domain-containing protein [Vibrio stylophorae]CAH0532284.1 hypothetical protein VST7929_00096 [Vibrio stylophorae]